MAVFRFSGVHANTLGSPTHFRTRAGLLPLGTGHGKGGITPQFSRKDETANLDAVRAQHNEVAAQFDSHRHNSIHITNNTEHIHRLNEGWSAQTPPGFVERAIYEAIKAIRGQWKLKSVT